MAKVKVFIKSERCKGCEMCIAVCPKNVLGLDEHEVNAQGYHAVTVVDEDACIGCIGCGLMCPEGAISIYREEE
ncbi:MAG: 4Fe-4S dicluster domain-containing protein [Parasporobacterium sp.]|nr:4Fe-4S dicluster domain-containing protein [Parasporobacterium sp.]